jgi:hypothetical protein
LAASEHSPFWETRLVGSFQLAFETAPAALAGSFCQLLSAGYWMSQPKDFQETDDGLAMFALIHRETSGAA